MTQREWDRIVGIGKVPDEKAEPNLSTEEADIEYFRENFKQGLQKPTDE